MSHSLCALHRCAENRGIRRNNRNRSRAKLVYSEYSVDWQGTESEEAGDRGLFVYVPACLKKPFFCETLLLQLDVSPLPLL